MLCCIYVVPLKNYSFYVLVVMVCVVHSGVGIEKLLSSQEAAVSTGISRSRYSVPCRKPRPPLGHQ